MSASETASLPPPSTGSPGPTSPRNRPNDRARGCPIVAVLLLGVGEGETGLLQTALTLPFILFAIPAGLLADRISRRRLMAGAEALRAIALLAILLLIGLHQLTMPLLALTGFVAVCGTVVYSVAAPALVPSLVSSRQLPAANARIELARTIAFASGPALGGVLVGWLGAAPPLRSRPRSRSSRWCCCPVFITTARGNTTAASPARDQGRRGVRAASSIAAAGVRHPVHFQHGLVPAARRLRALCGASPESFGTGVGVTLACMASAWSSARCWRRG